MHVASRRVDVVVAVVCVSVSVSVGVAVVVVIVIVCVVGVVIVTALVALFLLIFRVVCGSCCCWFVLFVIRGERARGCQVNAGFVHSVLCCLRFTLVGITVVFVAVVVAFVVAIIMVIRIFRV